MSMRRRGLDGASKRDQIQRQRDSAVKSLAYQGSTQNFTKRANDQEKITKKMENDFEVRDIQGQLDGAGLHADVRADLHNSEFSRKLAESTERDRTEEAHVMNNRTAYQQMYDAGENLEAVKSESKNEFSRTDQGEVNAQRLKVAGGDKKIIEGEHELAFQGSAIGAEQSLQMKAVDGNLDIVRGEQEIAFGNTGTGVDIAVGKDNVAQRKAVVTSQLEEVAVAENRNVRVDAAAAQQSLAAAKVGEDAFVEELKTDAGAAVAGAEFTTVAQSLQSSDTIKRVQTQRQANAQSVTVQDYAKAVGTDAANPSQLAVDAGGIAGAAGISQAQAVARQTMLEGANKAIAAEKSTMTKMKADIRPGQNRVAGEVTHMDIVKDPDASPERRAAAAGMIMQTGGMEDIHALSDYVQTMGGTPEETSAASDIRMQMAGDMNRTPFGWGASDLAALKRGDAMTDNSGNVKNYDTMADMRAKIKLSPERWVKLDPDDQKKLRTLAGDGSLSDEALQNLVEASTSALSNDNIDVSKEVRDYTDEILQAAKARGTIVIPAGF